WSNIAYVSIGRGGGQRFFTSSSNILRDSTGLIDWDVMEDRNIEYPFFRIYDKYSRHKLPSYSSQVITDYFGIC
ncbi:hypothetical protein N9W67_01880, partial [Crocinitomicaceae bacterium]|nr:hypothetical protein [Crocinitomicaceae bacterium]